MTEWSLANLFDMTDTYVILPHRNVINGNTKHITEAATATRSNHAGGVEEVLEIMSQNCMFCMFYPVLMFICIVG